LTHEPRAERHERADSAGRAQVHPGPSAEPLVEALEQAIRLLLEAEALLGRAGDYLLPDPPTD
jgi:hypothetical protein